jgi:hypothetical protein
MGVEWKNSWKQWINKNTRQLKFTVERSEANRGTLSISRSDQLDHIIVIIIQM